MTRLILIFIIKFHTFIFFGNRSLRNKLKDGKFDFEKS